jgi:N-acetylglucosamine repressor
MTQTAQPKLLRQINEREVFERVRRHGPTSRAELKRVMGVSAPTVSKAVARLVKLGLLEEVGVAAGGSVGRPVMVYQLAARERVQVLGATLAVEQCSVVAGGLDGTIDPDRIATFDTPDTYEGLIREIAARAQQMMGRRRGVRTLGFGISTPGEIDVPNQRVLSSPNLHMLDGRSPSRDLAKRLDVDVTMFHDTTAAGLAERDYGKARDLTDFVRIGVSEGFGASVVSGGRLLEGHDGMAGEFGHIVVDPDGERCGCGNRGCLETVATDAAFARAVSRRVGRPMKVDEVVHLAAAGELDVKAELERALSFLATGIGAAINVFNPQAVLVASRMLDADPRAMERLKELTAGRCLGALLGRCRVEQAEPVGDAGTIAGIIRHVTDALGPRVA